MQTKLELYQQGCLLAGLGMWEYRPVTGQKYCDPIGMSILGIHDEHYSENSEPLLSFYEASVVKDLIAAAMVTQQPQCAEMEFFTSPTTAVWIRIKAQGKYENGQCVRILGTLEDVSEQRQLNAALVENEQRFISAFSNAPIGMALVSISGQWIRVNKSLCNLMGYAEEEFVQHTFQDFTHPDDLNLDLMQMDELLQGNSDGYKMEKRYFHQKGHILWALLSVSLVRDSTGKPLYFISQVKDISERKRNQEIIEDQNKRLLDFAHIVSHNLRSHMGNIRMLTNFILEEKNAEERDTMIGMLGTNAKNMLDTLSYLNEVVKIYDNGTDGMEQLNLTNQVNRVLDILAPSLKSVESNTVVQIPESLSVKYNPAYLESVLLNLISNSIKYKHPDRALDIKIKAETMPGATMLTVRDNGLGIDLKLHGHKLFGMYKTFHKHDDARGMGLFLVKSHVQAMGGKIVAESVPYEFTQFNITINH